MKKIPHDLLLGAHMSIAGGIHTAIERANRIGCTVVQIFLKNSSRWQGVPLAAPDVETYKALLAKSSVRAVVAHDSYLINLCAVRPELLEKSRAALLDEFERAARLGIGGVILHPGSHTGMGTRDGIERIAESLNILHDKTHGMAVRSILETTAGQGTSIGSRFEELRAIIDRVDDASRVAVCIDTCHIFAAGYDIRTDSGWDTTMQAFDDIIGFERLAAVHANDSLRELGSHVDRHAHIGKGRIGLQGFRMLMNDPRFTAIPKILETPKGEDMHEDVINMRTLRKLARELHL